MPAFDSKAGSPWMLLIQPLRPPSEALSRPSTSHSKASETSCRSKIVDEKFGQAAPGLTSGKEAFEELNPLPGADSQTEARGRTRHCPGDGAADGAAAAPPAIAGFWTAGMPPTTPAPGSKPKLWCAPETSIRAAEDGGAGRAGDLRPRAIPAQTGVGGCLQGRGSRALARTVLEELNKQIAEFRLDQWESSALVGAVWSRLYRLYKKSEDE